MMTAAWRLSSEDLTAAWFHENAHALVSARRQHLDLPRDFHVWARVSMYLELSSLVEKHEPAFEQANSLRVMLSDHKKPQG